MYLDGQLPGGPPSNNTGGQVTPDGLSALWGDQDMGPQSDMPPDLSGSTFWVVPGGGSVVVSPSLATVDGIVQYPQNPMSAARRGDTGVLTRDAAAGRWGLQDPMALTRGGDMGLPMKRNAPSGWASENPEDWEPASCGMAGLGQSLFEDHYGRLAPEPETCRKIQCGAIPQSVAGMQLIADCAAAGYAGARSCKDPVCAPYCPTQQITPGPAEPLRPLRSPAPPNAYVPRRISGCPGYGSDGSLVTLRNNAGRQGGLSGCCQSGYQSVDDFKVPEKPVPWWLLGLAGLALMATTGDNRR